MLVQQSSCGSTAYRLMYLVNCFWGLGQLIQKEFWYLVLYGNEHTLVDIKLVSYNIRQKAN